MAGEDGKQIVENVAQDVLAEAVKGSKGTLTREAVTKAILDKDQADAGKAKKEVPEGCVVRTLSIRDRNLIIGACRMYVRGENKGKYKNQFKVDRVLKLLIEDETVEYFSMTNDAQAENLFKWQEQRQAYIVWRQMKGGLVKVDDFTKEFPGLDMDECPPKPPIKQPELTKDEQRGPAREFHIPAKVDTFIEEAIRDMEWGMVASEHVVELMERYGIEPESDRK